MLSSSLLQILITVWVGVHPVTYTIAKRYPATQAQKCQMRAAALFAMRKDKKQHMTIECVAAVGSEA